MDFLGISKLRKVCKTPSAALRVVHLETDLCF